MNNIPIALDIDADTYRLVARIAKGAGLTLSQVVESTFQRIVLDGCIHMDHFPPSLETLQAIEEIKRGDTKSVASVEELMIDLDSDVASESPMSPCCSQLQRNMFGEDPTVVFIAKFREYGLPISDGGSSIMTIKFCPWCGASLPSSLRDDWFMRLAEAGIGPYSPVPAPFHDERWYFAETKLS